MNHDSGVTSTLRVAIIGAGPAGLTAAYELTKHRIKPIVLEYGNQVGGIARTEIYKGFRFDIGGHRFFTKVGEVERLWHEILGDDFITVKRKSRIFYDGKFFDYPLQIKNALFNLGVYESFRVLLSYLRWKVRPCRQEDTFEQWVINRFGRRLYLHFFRSYTEKVWGMPCSEIRAEWAAQRIKDLSLRKAVINALTGKSKTTSLIDEFRYPRLGPGMMWERCAELVQQAGGEVRLQTGVEELHYEGDRVISVSARNGTTSYQLDVDHVISSMALPTLIKQLRPKVPDDVLEAADNLKYRDFLIVILILNNPNPFPDNWIYVHSPDVQVGRIQNFRSWSKEMVPDPKKSSLGMEYFCNQEDELWSMSNKQLIALASREIDALGLAKADEVVDGTVIRQLKAYPVYDDGYRKNVETLKRFLEKFKNLQTVGRNGMHRYNNQDHSMLTAMLAAQNVLGHSYDTWNVNVERSYHEDFVTKKNGNDQSLDQSLASLTSQR